jgi:hypothetical protein
VADWVKKNPLLPIPIPGDLQRVGGNFSRSGPLTLLVTRESFPTTSQIPEESFLLWQNSLPEIPGHSLYQIFPSRQFLLFIPATSRPYSSQLRFHSLQRSRQTGQTNTDIHERMEGADLTGPSSMPPSLDPDPLFTPSRPTIPRRIPQIYHPLSTSPCCLSTPPLSALVIKPDPSTKSAMITMTTGSGLSARTWL